MIERNWVGIKTFMKKAQLIERNWEGIEGTRDFKLETEFSSSHFDRSENRLNRSNLEEIEILKNFGKFFVEQFEIFFL